MRSNSYEGHLYEKCVDKFLVDRSKKVGLGQEANKTNGSPLNAKGIRRKLFHGRPPNSNLAKGSKKVLEIPCVVNLSFVMSFMSLRGVMAL